MRDRAAVDRRRRLRPLWVGLTVVLLAVAAYETVLLYGVIDAQNAIGTDLDYYQFVEQRWLDTGVFYTDRQLTGRWAAVHPLRLKLELESAQRTLAERAVHPVIAHPVRSEEL